MDKLGAKSVVVWCWVSSAKLGDIAYQSLAGALSTSTHGTGTLFTGLAGQVVGLRLIAADGSILNCSRSKDAEIFHVARVGLGALGIISTVILRVVPAFRLHAVEEPMRLDHLLEHLDEYVDGNDHFEFFWVPHTGWALTKRNNRTELPVDPSRRIRSSHGWQRRYPVQAVPNM